MDIYSVSIIISFHPILYDHTSAYYRQTTLCNTNSYYTRHDFHATPSSPTRRGLMSLEALESLSQESRQTVGHLSESLSDAQSDALTDLMRSVRKHFPTLDNSVAEGFCSASKPLSRFQAVISLLIVY